MAVLVLIYIHTTNKWQQTKRKYNTLRKSWVSKLEEEEGEGGWLAVRSLWLYVSKYSGK